MTNAEARLTSPLADVALYILEEWRLTPEQVRGLAANLADEYAAYHDEAAEMEWLEYYDPERVAARDEAYRRDMIAAGRGELLK